MPRRPQLPEECANCGRLSDHLIRGRCNTCYSYWRKHDHTERPLHLWAWSVGAAVWELAGERDVCDCGEPATEKLTVRINGGERGVLLLCEGCAELERRLTPGSSWAD